MSPAPVEKEQPLTTATISEQDLRTIWTWNAELPMAVEACVHDVIAQQTKEQPQAPAVCAWDGDLTYGDLDTWSTRLASQLVGLGVSPAQIVPLCFEKSMWTAVAVIGVMKARGTCIMMDSSQPEARLRTITQQVDPQVILSSSVNKDLAGRLTPGGKVIVVDRTQVTGSRSPQDGQLPKTKPSDRMYLNFTSGSTGVPKGAIITHRNFCSAMKYQAPFYGLTRSSRVFDFASYAFDISWFNVLYTLSCGGCLCVPSDLERRDDITEAIERYRVSHIMATPSTVRLLHFKSLSTVQTMILVGEPLYFEEAYKWAAGSIKLENVYGPCECTPVTTGMIFDQDTKQIHIGRGHGVRTWIVESDTQETLVPIGEVGELWLEGPLVGSGYFNDPEKTAASFFDRPPWLLHNWQHFQTREHDRFYRTGDLVRYNPDGTLVFIGRKDTQVKIRGQRVELGDIEYHIHRNLTNYDDIQVVAEIIIPKESIKPILVAFLAIRGSSGNDAKTAMKTITAEIYDKLTSKIPGYMIPVAYIILDKIPVTSNVKADRRRLREIGGRFTLQELTSLNTSQSKKVLPATRIEQKLRNLCASILNIDVESIGVDDSFLQIGGDSVEAMRLVGAARKLGLTFTVFDVFSRPRLRDLAEVVVEKASSGTDQGIDAFSLLKKGHAKEKLRVEVAEFCNINPVQVEDVFPCTPLQESLLALSAKRASRDLIKYLLELDSGTNIARFQKALDEVFSTTPILRTRILDIQGEGLVQAVINENMKCSFGAKLTDYLATDDQLSNVFAMPLVQFVLVEEQGSESKKFLVFSIHHALHDQWSLALLLEKLYKVYSAKSLQPPPAFQLFVKHVANIDRDHAVSFWKQQLTGSEAQAFPVVPSLQYQPTPDQMTTQDIADVQWPKTDITATTAIRAAWSILIAQYTNTSEVIFGAVVMGRQMSMSKIEQIIGPTIALVPVRVVLSHGQEVRGFLQQIQDQTIEMTAYEQMGLQQIRRIDSEVAHGGRFQTLLVVQPIQRANKEQSSLFKSLSRADRQTDHSGDWLKHYNTYGLMVEFQLEESSLQVDVSFDSKLIERKQVDRLIQQFAHILRQLCQAENQSKSLVDLRTASEQDLCDIWTWNDSVPEAAQTCVHDLITARAKKVPEAPAICAWDGELTYRELTVLSTQLAHQLVGLGVCTGHTIPLCFEKSMWAPVAVLGVMKAGGASVFLDPDQPEARLRTIMQQVNPMLLLSSASNEGFVRRFSPCSILVINKVHIEQGTSQIRTQLPAVRPSDHLYVVFTSGTTGKPKGAVMSHSNFSSAVVYQQIALGFKDQARVYDFASYVFDVAWSNILHTLTAGCCLCIPSESDRRNDLLGSLRSLRATFIDLTPSLAKSLNPEEAVGLEYLLLSGEPLGLDVALKWANSVCTINNYGPAECTVKSHLTKINQGCQRLSIGYTYGMNSWIVEPTAGKSLTPWGAIGELWLEGPLVGVGYYKDPEKTKAAFVDDPPWLLQGGPGKVGRHGRLYRTGDLVQYMSDGTLVVVGRKDTQVKIRGQRIELAEVEYHMQHILTDSAKIQVVPEVITPRKSKDPMLVAFLKVDDNANTPKREVYEFSAAYHRTEVKQLIAKLEQNMAGILPAYMVPAAYIPLDDIPITTNGKRDRQQLQKIGAALTLEQLTAFNEPDNRILRAPATHMESQLRDLWAFVLGIDAYKIGIDDSFFRIGGDSIGAMRLAGAARKQNLCLKVTDIFEQPRLCDLAELTSKVSVSGRETVKAFSLIKVNSGLEELLERAANLCDITTTQIEDIYPCTPLQEGLLALTAKRAGDYISQLAFEVQNSVNMDRFQKAWEMVVATTPILRTRIADISGHGLVQIVVKEPVTWHSNNNLAAYLTTNGRLTGNLGQPLSRFGLVQEQDNTRVFVWTLHHALHDEWSISLILQKLESGYLGSVLQPSPQFQTFIKHTIDVISSKEATKFWQEQFSGSRAEIFPALPSTTYEPIADQVISHRIEQLEWPESDYTPATVIKAGWSLLTARYTASSEAVFGATVMGRQAAVPDIEQMIGPTIATVPIRVILSWKNRVHELLEQIQKQAVEIAAFEQIGLQSIRRIDHEIERGSQFQTLLNIEPLHEAVPKQTILSEMPINTMDKMEQDGDELGRFNSYALLLECRLQMNGLALEISFDSNVVDVKQAQRIAQNFEQMLRQICTPECQTKQLGEIQSISKQDLYDIWSWNINVPEAADTCVHDLIANMAQAQPGALAICAWDGDLSYEEFDKLSTEFAYQLAAHGVCSGVIVPLCFEKSKWTPVAMLAVMKAGGAPVALDLTLPEQHLRTLLQQIKPRVMVSSSNGQMLACRLMDCMVIALDHTLFTDSLLHNTRHLPAVEPSDMLYLVFTSGSTGIPKGSMITHRNFSSAMHHQAPFYGIEPSSRVFDFTSYAFDMAWFNVLCTLSRGACLCIPSEDERRDDLGSSLTRYDVSHVVLTPSTARLLQPIPLRRLNTLMLIGEPLYFEEASKWAASVNIENMYGPCECTPITTRTSFRPNAKRIHIGRGTGVNTWIVDQDMMESLTPIGGIGELWLEGPLVGSGYLNDPERTAASFIHDPPWLLNPSSEYPGVSGRRGKLYRTGDLVRYQSDGALVFVGRKDAQRKVHGQRVEMGEIEHNIRNILLMDNPSTQVAAEVVRAEGSIEPVLVAFLVIDRKLKTQEDGHLAFKAVIAQLESKLAAALPKYMIPRAYITVDEIPMTATGKTDRQRLRNIGGSFTLEQLMALNPSRRGRRSPCTETEKQLSSLCASLLDIDIESFGVDDSFLQIGGDSIMAMRLTTLARGYGLHFAVADVFRQPRLCDLARVIRRKSRFGAEEVKPFSLLRANLSFEKTCRKVSAVCKITATQIKDVLPCTPLQEGLLALTVRGASNYISRNVFQIQTLVDIARFRNAWEEVFRATPILRTRIVDLAQHGLVQVVVDEPLQWQSEVGLGIDQNNLKECVEADKQAEMGMGTRLVRFWLTQEVGVNNERYLIWTIHHALFDEWSMSLILEKVEKAYHGERPTLEFGFENFLKHLSMANDDRAAHLWQEQFAESEAQTFPALPSVTYHPIADKKLQHKVAKLQWPESDITAPTAIRTAWSILAARYTDSQEALFGATVLGRQADIPGIEQIIGPTIATVPIRVKLGSTKSIEELLQQVQWQAVEMTDIEQFGLQRIRRISPEVDKKSQFQTLLVIQPVQSAREQRSLFTDLSEPNAQTDRNGLEEYSPYALSMVCQLKKQGVHFDIRFDSNILDCKQVERMIGQLEHVLRQICDPKNWSRRLNETELISEQDLNDIWSWNRTVPERIEACIHDLFSEKARTHPEAHAICAWDGNMTYRELDAWSTQLANHLVDLGMDPGTTVPLCFEKSMWTSLAIFGIMKAGGASIVMDPSQPEARLCRITQQVKSSLILCSANYKGLANRLGSYQVLVIDRILTARLGSPTNRHLPVIDPSHWLYVVFTSGSTGLPKGAVITHSNFSSAVRHQYQALGLGPCSRILESASYAFDAIWSTLLHTLLSGGCICIPSDAHRKNNLAESMRQFKVTHAGFTPTTARLLKPVDVPCLQTLYLAGESLLTSDITTWMDAVDVRLGYGPAECTVLATSVDNYKNEFGPSYIGRGTGLTTWIVDPVEETRLAPIGTVGELWLEGALVGDGYFDDPIRTAETFVKDPPWLVQGTYDQKGRHGRLYRTGDLVRYKSDGGLVFIGRKDEQVKIRGQRVELGEIEYHVRTMANQKDISVVAEVITPLESNNPLLVVFLEVGETAGKSEDERRKAMKKIMFGLEKRLVDLLPAYMIPTLYYPVDKIPVNANGKTDRRRLREMSGKFTLEQLLSRNTPHSQKRAPTTQMEQSLRDLWANVLGINPKVISLDDSFLRIGGDSIGAMRLVGAAREQGLLLTVASIFQQPRLCDMARVTCRQASTRWQYIPPFSLLNPEILVKDVRDQAATLCGVQATQIEDIFPCTPLQEGLLALTVKQSGGYISRNVFRLSEDVDINQFRRAWEETVMTTPILRTRITDLVGQGLVQVVVSDRLRWMPDADAPASDLEQYMRKDEEATMGLGTPLMRSGLVEEQGGDRRYLVWTMHHALFDAWTISLLLSKLDKIYRGEQTMASPPFQTFIKYIKDLDRSHIVGFWQSQFLESQAQSFPALPDSSRMYQPKATGTFTYSIDGLRWPDTDITPSTVIRAAWSVIIALYTNTREAVFGMTVTGRQAAIPGIEAMIGPTIATVPVRVVLDHTKTIQDLFVQIQKQGNEMTDFEQAGLQRIRRISSELNDATQFQALLVIQPAETSTKQPIWLLEHPKEINQTEETLHKLGVCESYLLILEVQMKERNLQLDFTFDVTTLDNIQVQRIASQFEHMLHQLCAPENETKCLAEIETVSEQDLEDIWDSWNAKVPETIDACVHDLIKEKALAQPQMPAICAWNGSLTYKELDERSTELACELLKQNVSAGSIVLLYLEKSMWAPLAMLAVMKAGGASVAIDSSQPEARQRAIVEQIRPVLLLTSLANQQLASQLTNQALFVIDAPRLMPPEPSLCLNNDLPLIRPLARLYVIFTSGSTGTPKGLVITHRNLSSAIYHQQQICSFEAPSRVFDFCSYTFDASWLNSMFTFSSGGCLCIPSESERKDNLNGAIERYKASHIFLTPSVARLLDLESCSSLHTIVLGGELLHVKDAQELAKRFHVIHGYGPSECTPFAAVKSMNRDAEVDTSVGRGAGTNLWVVDPEGEKLAPIGSIGELWLEGPLVGSGYFENQQATAAAYIEDPPWLMRGFARRSGRRGRLFRTGDLARYGSDGSLLIVGRKDAQVKIRGQRVELDDVDYHIRKCLQDVAKADCASQLIVPLGRTVPILVTFIAAGRKSDMTKTELQADVQEIVPRLSAGILNCLPGYMSPTAFIAVEKIPLTPGGKTDRRRMQEIGGSLNMEQLITPNLQETVRRPPEREIERQLRKMWASILEISENRIGKDDNFLRIGGDSIAAMRLVGGARKEGLSLTVLDIFKFPRLCDMAKVITQQSNSGEDLVEPFSLLEASVSESTMLRSQIAASCCVDADQIEDIFPCTPMQEGLLALTAKRANDYISQSIFELRSTTDFDRLRLAWDTVVSATPILRTRLVQVRDQGLMQVIINEGAEAILCDSLETYFRGSDHAAMSLNHPLMRYGMIKGLDAKQKRFLVLTIHHALFDGWSMSLMLERLERAYLGEKLQPTPQFQLFIKHVSQMMETKAAYYWREQLEGLEAQVFPIVPSAAYQSQANGLVTYRIGKLPWSTSEITTSTAVRAAWSILISRYTDSNEAIFGATVTGRQAPIFGVEEMTGPTIATVPLRVKMDQRKSVNELLEQVQRQAVEMTLFEQMGLQHIRRLSPEAERGCQFQSLLVIQPVQQPGKTWSLLFEDSADIKVEHDVVKLGSFNSYALMLECQLQEQGIQLDISFDPSILEEKQVERIARQLEHVLQQICTPEIGMKTLAEIEVVSHQDLFDIWNWNTPVPETFDACVHDLFAAQAQAQPNALAVQAWDGSMTYNELHTWSTKFAHCLFEAGIAQGALILLCFEKSMWTAVAIMAVMKIGAASVMMDVNQPDARLRTIVHQVKPAVVISSATSKQLAGRLSGSTVIVLDKAQITRLMPPADWVLPTVNPSAKLYVVFTSGSTGIPKGAIISHQNFTSAIKHQQSLLGFDNHARVYDFASYAFDVAWSNVLHTLTAGACLCVPSEYDRKNNLLSSLRSFQATLVDFTPSLAQSLNPAEVPCLKDVLLSGELLGVDVATNWARSTTVINNYGLAECAVKSHLTRIEGDATAPLSIGYAYGCNSWIVDSNIGDCLAPLGAVGELWLEGPIVGLGYLSDPVKTAAAFLDDPPWLLKGGPSHIGRRGRLYRTGDLVRYNSDGTLVVTGRKDTQAKIRGQRVELGEIESYIRKTLEFKYESQVVAELITPRDSSSATLVAFIELDKGPDHQMAVNKLITRLEDDLKNNLPVYMVPTAYYPMDKIPMTTTGKTDRVGLRQLGATLTLEQLTESHARRGEKRAPTTRIESLLQDLWAALLCIDPDRISIDDNFLRIGGDSILAMQLVGLAYEQGLSLSVANIFLHPRLRDMAKIARAVISADEYQSPPPFTLLKTQDIQTFLQHRVFPDIGHDIGQVVDVLPTTDFQRAAVLNAFREPPTQWPHFILDFPGNTDLARLKWACSKLVEIFDILRTVFVEIDGEYWQVILREVDLQFDVFESPDDLNTFVGTLCEQDLKVKRTLGSTFVRFIAVKGTQGVSKLIFRLSHAQYDGYSSPHLFKTLASIYEGKNVATELPCFRDFLTYTASQKARSFEHWRRRLQGAPVPTFVSEVPAKAASSVTDQVSKIIRVRMPRPTDAISPATFFYAACAIALSRYTSQMEVVFGRIVTGRTMLPSHLQAVAGPCLTEVPVRIHVRKDDTILDVGTRLQQQFIQNSSFESLGKIELIRNSTDWPEEISDFGWLTSFQQGKSPPLTISGQEYDHGYYARDTFPPDQPELYAFPMDGELKLLFIGRRTPHIQQGMDTIMEELERLFREC